MTAAADPVDLPAPTGWDFGDFAYGLELLTLPEPAEDGAGPDDAPRAVAPEVVGSVRRLEGVDPCPRVGPELPSRSAAHQLYWFRWITGHQATFALWQRLTDALHAANADPSDEVALADMAELVEAYNVMLLYTSSCPRDVYHEVIRPSMFLQHRGFSGTWAPDYRPVREMMHGKPHAWSDTPGGARVRAALKRSARVHGGVAAKLVPGGRSLLKEATDSVAPPTEGTTGVIYDNFFLTLRGPVSRSEVLAQTTHRLRAIALDVADNGLYPGESTGEDLPPELAKPETVAAEQDFSATLARTAAIALRQSAARPPARR